MRFHTVQSISVKLSRNGLYIRGRSRTSLFFKRIFIFPVEDNTLFFRLISLQHSSLVGRLSLGLLSSQNAYQGAFKSAELESEAHSLRNLIGHHEVNGIYLSSIRVHKEECLFAHYACSACKSLIMPQSSNFLEEFATSRRGSRRGWHEQVGREVR